MVSTFAMATGCVAGDADDEGPGAEPVAGLDGDAAAPLLPEQRPDPVAGCTATVDRFVLGDGSCAARATIRFECTVATQVHDWARVGVLCDGEVCAYDDVAYRCGAELARSFEVPCGAVEVVAGATFDHPVTSADVSCLSE
jgi:hypothetical protein